MQNKNIRKVVGDRLRELRRNNALTQKEMAQLRQVDTTLVGKQELGQRSVDAETLNWYCTRFNVSMNWIFGITDDPNIEIKNIPSDRGDIEVGVNQGHGPLTEYEISQLRKVLAERKRG